MTLVLALTLAAFTGMVRAAVVGGETAASWQATGADVVVASGQLGISPSAARAIAAVPGVQRAAAALVVPLTTSDGGQVVTAIVVDPASYAALVASTEGFSGVRPALLTQARGQGAIPVLASPQAAACFGGRTGSTILAQEGLPALRIQVSGELRSTPALPWPTRSDPDAGAASQRRCGHEEEVLSRSRLARSRVRVPGGQISGPSGDGMTFGRRAR